MSNFLISEGRCESNEMLDSGFFETYTAVVNNLDDGGELASVGAAADQDEAANLDQLPGSELNVDIGHREFLEGTKKVSALVLFFHQLNCCSSGHSRSTGMVYVGGLLSRVSDCPG